MESSRSCESCGALNAPLETECHACGAVLRSGAFEHPSTDLQGGPASTAATPGGRTPGFIPSPPPYGGYGAQRAYPGYGPYPAYPAYGGYGHSPWAHPYMAPVAVPLVPQQESLALWSLIMGIVGLVVCQPVGTIAAILGFISLRRIGAAEHALKGKGMAVAGIIMGSLATLWMIVILFILVQNPDLFTSA